MAVYAIGDIQGCVVALEELLDDLQFDPEQDRLWLTGDLVNRGPDSLATLRMVKRLGDSATSVLGNHDLHLLAVAEGIKSLRPGDTVKKILEAGDSEDLLHWLRHRPMVHFDRSLRTLMVHAGVYPGWSASRLRKCAIEVEQILQGPDYRDLLVAMYGREPLKWRSGLSRMDRLRFITNAITRMRYVDQKRRLDFEQKGPPGSQPKGLIPWYMHPKMRCGKWRIVCGHWSALGYMRSGRVIALDSGCVWGGALTAVRLDNQDTRQCWQVGCRIQD